MSSDETGQGGSSAGFPAAASGSMGAAPPAADPMVGQILDNRYRLVAKLGEGGMGEVYAAEHVHIEKRLAIKLLRPEIVSNSEAVGRFRQEARSASSIGHKNIIGIEDFGTLGDGRIYLAMELLEGLPLNDMLEQPLDPVRLINILIQTGHGLAAAHQKGIVHRDMKPENVFVTTGDVPKLLDFGIAKVAQGEGENHLTRTGTIFGTPFYMAPEQALGQTVDHRADIYAMGVIMYECFCGSVPFQGESFMGILTQHITAEPKPPDVAAHQYGRMLPPGIAGIITRCMAKDPNQRFQSMDELVEALVAVYRAVAGAGMSAYLEVQHIPRTGVGPAMATPMPTPMPYLGAQSTPTPSPSVPSYVSSAAAAASSQTFEAPKKSRVGLVVAVLLLLGLAGGGGAYYWTQMRGAGAVASTTPDAAPVAAGPADAAPVAVAVVFDAAPAPTPPDAAPKVTPTTVLLDSSPGGADVYVGGEKVDRTPTNIKVTPGSPIEVVLKRRGYEDETVVLDGSESKISASLSRIRVERPKDPKDPKDAKDPKDPKNGNTGNPPAQPRKCSAAWCKLPGNGGEPCCALE